TLRCRERRPSTTSGHSNPANDQILLSRFSDAAKQISSAGSIEYNKVYNMNGWELIFSERPTDLLPVIKHALYIP
ncbi:hypothetical protein, partial [Rhizobium anhuiense]|uniref:hypothetical protein n=1 Tax=Rhizobium anhuiense TaxID=1184720 RepID=UPI001AEF50A3